MPYLYDPSQTERERAYALILRRQLLDILGPCALYEYTALQDPRFAQVHTADNIGALLDWMREWLHADIADELAYNEDFWQNADVDILAIADPDLRAFVQYACHTSTFPPVYDYEKCLYMAEFLDDLPDGGIFVIAWESHAPRQDVVYAIVAHPERNGPMLTKR